MPNIRGGICHKNFRYACAINKLISSLYDQLQLTSYIMEVYANNLYSWAMSQEMPDGDFKSVSKIEFRDIILIMTTQTAASSYSTQDYSIIGRIKTTKKFYFQG